MSDDDLGLEDMLSRIAESESDDPWDFSQGLDESLTPKSDSTPGDDQGLIGDSPDYDSDDFPLSGPADPTGDSLSDSDDDFLLSSTDQPPVSDDDFAAGETPLDDDDLMAHLGVPAPDEDHLDDTRAPLTDEDFGALSEMVSMDATADDYPTMGLREMPPLDPPSDDVDPDEVSAFIERDLVSIRLAAERQAQLDDSDNVLLKQMSTNARGRSIQNLPTGISMIELNDDLEDPEVTRAGDEKRLKWMAIAAMSIVVSVVASVSVALMVRPEIPAPIVAYGQGQSVGGGEVIDRNAAPAGAPGENSMSRSGSSGSEAVVPDGGSRITYKVKSEGDIASASATYVDASGLPVQETGISLPWEITVGAKASVTPNFAVAARGFGTLTCEVTSDGKVVAEKTSTGESPTVNCTG